MICNFGNIVIVPFPFVDNAKSKSRPALIVSSKAFNESHSHSVMAMITTSTSTSWESDVLIQNLKLAGLPVKSSIRVKLFTLDNRLIKKTIGSLDQATTKEIKKVISSYLFV